MCGGRHKELAVRSVIRNMTAMTTDTSLMRDLQATNASVGLARRIVDSALRAWSLAHLTDTATLIVSELTTNAIRPNSPASQIRLALRLRADGLVIGVWDGAPSMPSPRPAIATTEQLDAAAEDDIGGWGLGVVGALSLRTWTAPDAGGKWVCALIGIRREEER
jgi:anti-sigma regulatory factor (Ser/Thr protein kinase)